MIQTNGTFGGGAKLNGIKGNYLATDDVAKGDFVQLTTWGVEDVALQEALSWDVGYATGCAASVAVLSPTQVIVAWNNEPKSTGATDNYAQVVTYKNGSWVSGTAVFLATGTRGNYPSITVEKWTNNRAVVTLDATTGSTTLVDASALWVLEVSDEGEITVIASQEGVNLCNAYSAAYSAKMFSLSDEKLLLIGYGAYGTGNTEARNQTKARILLYENGIFEMGDWVQVRTSEDGKTYPIEACKVNDSLIWAGNYKISVTGSAISVVLDRSDLGVESRDSLLYWEDNKMLFIDNTKKSPYFITYDPTTGVFTKGENLLETAPNYVTDNAVRLSDDKVCGIAKSSGTTTGTGLSLAIIDVNEKTYTATSADALNLSMTSETQRVYAADGWYAIINGYEQLLVAPCVSQTTAAPYVTRLDGVATKGASAGGIAEVVTPE